MQYLVTVTQKLGLEIFDLVPNNSTYVFGYTYQGSNLVRQDKQEFFTSDIWLLTVMRVALDTTRYLGFKDEILLPVVGLLTDRTYEESVTRPPALMARGILVCFLDKSKNTNPTSDYYIYFTPLQIMVHSLLFHVTVGTVLLHSVGFYYCPDQFTD